MSLLDRAWALLRRDIGRKLTALALALGTWFLLESLVLDDGGGQLEVRVVASLDEANADRAQTGLPAIYLVAPPELIVLDHTPKRVRLEVKGLRDDVQALNLSAVVELGEKDLAGGDEATVIRTLGRADFKSRGDPPELTDFQLNRDATVDLTIALARRATASLALGPANVAVDGKPAEGYAFDAARIQVSPNVVDVSGPRAAVQAVLADPSLLLLAPVSLAGRSATLQQNVPLGAQALAARLALSTRDGRVLVTVPLAAAPVDVDLFLIPVDVENADWLATRRLRLVEPSPATVDVKLRGPKPELSRYTPEELSQQFILRLDYRRASPLAGINRPALEVYRKGLSEAVQVLAADGASAPKVQFKLEEVLEQP